MMKNLPMPTVIANGEAKRPQPPILGEPELERVSCPPRIGGWGRDRIVAPFTKGMAAAEALGGEPGTFEGTMAIDRLQRILGTSGHEATGWRGQGRNEASVAFN